MDARAARCYVRILFDLQGSSDRTVQAALRGQEGIVRVDAMDGPPDLLVTVEGASRAQALANANQAVDSLSRWTVRFLRSPILSAMQSSDPRYAYNRHGTPSTGYRFSMNPNKQ